MNRLRLHIIRSVAGLALLLMMMSACAQQQPFAFKNFVPFRIGTIPERSDFKRLTFFERVMDSMQTSAGRRRLQLIRSNRAFVPGTPRSVVDSARREQQLMNALPYRTNRSRYHIVDSKNGEALPADPELDSAGSPCSCYLAGDTIRIRMGIWVFGGFAVGIDLAGRSFSSAYWIDVHKLKIFKLQPSDTLSDQLDLPIAEQDLVLDSLPRYVIGQQLTGYLTFRTAAYLRAADYKEGIGKDEYSDKDMDHFYTTGIVRFTCRVRPRLRSDSE